MNRFTRTIRLARALKAIWTWHPPRGVTVYTCVDVPGRTLRGLLESPTNYLDCAGPWACLSPAAVRLRLDGLVRVLAEQERLLDALPAAPSPAPGLCPSAGCGDAEFEQIMSRLRARGHILPISDHRKGGAGR